MFKAVFVKKDSRNEIGRSMALVPTGTTLHDAYDILRSVFSKANPSMQGQTIDCIEVEGFLIARDEELNTVPNRETVVVVIHSM